MALIMTFLACSMTSCGKDGSDLEYIKSKGKLVIGITEFAPMDYKEDGSDEWVGFDADMAKAFAKEIGVTPEFVIIEWGKKIPELNAKTIDCVWNGMTLTDDVKSAMSTSNPYCTNMQVVVLPKDKADQYTTLESVKDLKFAAEKGSAGEKLLVALEYSVTAVDKQSTALSEVVAGTSDAAVIDLLMAGAMIGEGTSYESLTYTVALNEDQKEEYGVGFRKDSDLTAKLNDFMKKYYESGEMQKLAEKYGVKQSLIPQE